MFSQSCKKRFGKAKTYEEWCEPKLVSNALDILDEEIPRLKDKIESVHLCFSTDPFMYGYEDIAQMSFAIIKKLNDAGKRKWNPKDNADWYAAVKEESEAKKAFETILAKYPSSTEAQDIEKYIAIAE